jgi:hypothetical protein
VRPHEPARTFAAPAAEVPSIQCESGIPELRHRLGRIDEIRVVAVLATEVLPPQLQAQVARELPSAVAEAGRIDGFAHIARFVDDRT